MAEQAVGLHEEPKMGAGAGLVGMLNVFVDPKGAAKSIPAPLSWLWPLIAVSIIYGVSNYLMLPYTLQVVDIAVNQRMAQNNAPAEQIENARRVAHMFYQFLPEFVPVIILLVILLLAGLVLAMGSVAGLRVKFRNIFALMMCCQLIPSLQAIASYIVVRGKGDEIISQEQLTPPFGLDIFLHDIHGALFGLVNFFSIFEIWYLIAITIAFAYMAKTTKGKAFFALTPVWLLPLLLRVIQAMFQGPQANG